MSIPATRQSPWDLKSGLGREAGPGEGCARLLAIRRSARTLAVLSKSRGLALGGAQPFRVKPRFRARRDIGWRWSTDAPKAKRRGPARPTSHKPLRAFSSRSSISFRTASLFRFFCPSVRVHHTLPVREEKRDREEREER